MRKKLSIRARLVWFALLATLVVTAGYTACYVVIAYDSASSELVLSAKNSLDRLRIVLDFPLWNYSPSSCSIIASSELTNPDLLAVVVRTGEGRIFASLGKARDEDSRVLNALDEDGLALLAMRARFAESATISHEGKVIGQVAVYTTFAPRTRALAVNIIIAAILALFIGGVIATGLFFYVERVITSRLVSLEATLGLFAGGDFAARSKESAFDVIGNLGSAFNLMADTIVERNRELESRVEEREAKLLQAEKLSLIGSLAAGLAHEVNTPLGISITASSHARHLAADLLTAFHEGGMTKHEFTKSIAGMQETFALIDSNLSRAVDFVRTFKKIASDQAADEDRPFNVGEYLGETVLSLRPKLKKTRIKVEIDCPEDLVVEATPSAIYHIVSNLISNSLMHGFDEGQEGRIQIAVTRQEKLLVIDYRDNGRGIPEEVLGRIFEPFYTTKRGSGGTGLGLHIIQSIARNLGGDAVCTSEPGKGVRFLVTLPLVVRETAEQNP